MVHLPEVYLRLEFATEFIRSLPEVCTGTIGHIVQREEFSKDLSEVPGAEHWTFRWWEIGFYTSVDDTKLV